jgi:hypothetical protein
MTTKTKKIIFWVVIALLVIGIGLYLKFANFGDALMSILIGLMSILIGACGIVVGWLAHIFYAKYIKA